MFFDRAKIFVKAGEGGEGIVAFRREKHQAKGGPAGGNGGRGGHVVAAVDPGMNTLHRFRRHVHYRAAKGGRGGGTDKRGAQGDDLVIRVPPGTLIRDAESQDLIADLTHDAQSACIARGGRGGRGNAAFRNSRNQVPRMAEKGEPGEERWLALELKLVAEVGIIGVPNAGKSTLLSRLSAARPQIADYPFTTITPNLGVVEVEHRQRVFIDVPGLVEGAHTGTGLGMEFLRHVERTRMLVHLLDGTAPDLLAEMTLIENELQLYSPELARKPRLIVLNKLDLPMARQRQADLASALDQRHLPLHAISAATGEAVPDLIFKVDRMLQELPVLPETVAVPEIVPHTEDRTFTIRQTQPGYWHLACPALEKRIKMINWDYFESTMRFQHMLESWGIRQALQQQGIAEGDTVLIADFELIWGYDNAF